MQIACCAVLPGHAGPVKKHICKCTVIKTTSMRCIPGNHLLHQQRWLQALRKLHVYTNRGTADANLCAAKSCTQVCNRLKTCCHAQGAGGARAVEPVGQCDAVQGSAAQGTGVEGPVLLPVQVRQPPGPRGGCHGAIQGS